MKYIKCKNDTERIAGIAVLESLGYKRANWKPEHYPNNLYLFIDKGEIHAKRICEQKDTVLFRNFLLNPSKYFRIKPSRVQVPLNGSYTAEVSLEGITVGCQTFPVEIVKKLSEALNSLK